MLLAMENKRDTGLSDEVRATFTRATRRLGDAIIAFGEALIAEGKVMLDIELLEHPELWAANVAECRRRTNEAQERVKQASDEVDFDWLEALYDAKTKPEKGPAN